ncbi:MAG TPA: putative glycoside hydrolase [Solirubrobacter sp.]|nr:putative glycoside hydrolase [Solirubrobacter sp.]
MLAILVTAPATAHAASPVGHFRVAIDSAAATADYTSTAARNDVVILQQYQAPRMKTLKAANPGVKVLMYKNLSGMTERQPSGFVSGGVATQDAAAHPEWYLLNTGGERFTSRYFNWIWIGDVGSPSYQQQWADNVLGEVAADGWDGVFMDDVNPTMSWHYDVSRIAKYPTDAAWQAATRSALSAIGSRFRAAGKLVIANFSNSKAFPAVIKDWYGLVDGGLNEQFLKWGTNTTGPESYDPADYWELQLKQMKEAEAAGKYYLGLTPSTATDRAAARYGYATMLLAGAGKLQFALHSDYTNERWFPEYDYALGTPLDAETREAGGVHRRRFSHGLVLVNPTASAVAVDFGGAYTGSGLETATAATLAPRSALVLTKVGEDEPGDGGAGVPPVQDDPVDTTDPVQPVDPLPPVQDDPVDTTDPVQPVDPVPPVPAKPRVPPITRVKPIRITLTCKLVTACRGTVALKRGDVVVGKRTVKVRAGKSLTISMRERVRATIAKARRLKVKAPHGLRAKLR